MKEILHKEEQAVENMSDKANTTQAAEHTHTCAAGSVHTHAHAKGQPHAHAHNHPNQKAVSNRLARAIGHLEKVKKMVDSGEDCTEILIQLAAVRSAITNAGKVLLTDHINHCIVEAVEEGDLEKIDELNAAIKKFV